MKLNSPLLLSAVAIPAFLAFALPADEVTFGPSAGSSITKTFTTEWDYALDGWDMLMNGESPPMMPEMEMDMKIEQSISVTDEYAAIEDGVVQKLARTFEDLGQKMTMEVSVEVMGENQGQSAEGSGSSELEGSTVVFTWDGDEEAYVPSFADGDGDEDLLENLAADMDYRRLLPDGSVSEGDEWDIPKEALVDVLAPGGDPSWDVEMEGMDSPMGGPDPEMMTNVREMLGDLMDGDFKGSYAGTREADGVKVAVIKVTVDIESARDMSELMSEAMESEEMPMPVELERVDAEFTLEAEGELLWNLEAGRLHSFDLSGDSSVAMDMAMSMDMGQPMEMEMTMEMSGTLNQTVRTEGAD